LIIKNTFIDDGLRRSPSLENMLRGRQVHSCPGSRLPTPKGGKPAPGLQEPVSSTASTVDTSEVSGAEESQAKWDGVPAPSTPTLQMNAWTTPGMENWVQQERLQLEQALPYQQSLVTELPPHLLAAPPRPNPSPQPQVPAAAAAGGSRRAVFSLEQALAFGDEGVGLAPPAVPQRMPPPTSFQQALEVASVRSGTPELGSPELPSVGSLGHHIRRCKPCAFATRMGCSNGVQCQFCHLCETGEKKRRRKEKRALIGAARKLAAGELAVQA
jgi:hypothetical protein